MAVIAGNSVAEAAKTIVVGRPDLLLLLENPSALKVAQVLIEKGAPDSVVRAALSTLLRFSIEVAENDLDQLLSRGALDPKVPLESLQKMAGLHRGISPAQLALLAFGPKLWWTFSGVEISWRPIGGTVGTSDELSKNSIGEDGKLLLLAVIGSGATFSELMTVSQEHLGALNFDGMIKPDAFAEPLAISYLPSGGTARKVTFLSFALRNLLIAKLEREGMPSEGEPILLSWKQFAAAELEAAQVSSALIKAGNDVNVALCRATGDFFRSWGMPGSRFQGPEITSEWEIVQGQKHMQSSEK